MRLFFHYNKSLSKKAGVPKISLHYKGKCSVVDNVVLNVKSWGKINKRQPFFVVQCDCEEVKIEDGVALIS